MASTVCYQMMMLMMMMSMLQSADFENVVHFVHIVCATSFILYIHFDGLSAISGAERCHALLFKLTFYDLSVVWLGQKLLCHYNRWMAINKCSNLWKC